MINKNILVLADFACSTGFSAISENIVRELLLDSDVQYQIDVIGINYYGKPNAWQSYYPRVRLYSASAISQGDVFGMQGLIDMASTGRYDYVYILQDTFIVRKFAAALENVRLSLEKRFKWIYYFPIDAQPQDEWIKEGLQFVDTPIAYTQYGWDEVNRISPEIAARTKVVPHGFDMDVFHPLPKDEIEEFRNGYFAGVAKDRLVIMNVNRNQPRKDIGRSLQVFAELKKTHPEYLLYLHMSPVDVGINIFQTAKSLGLELQKDFMVTNKDFRAQYFPPQVLNQVYNACDAVFTTSLGEGWGLSLTEAMATKTPVIAPMNSAIPEVCGFGKYAQLCDASNQIIIANDNGAVRYQTDIRSMIECITKIGNEEHAPYIQKMVKDAYDYVTGHLSWATLGITWRKILKEA